MKNGIKSFHSFLINNKVKYIFFIFLFFRIDAMIIKYIQSKQYFFIKLME